MKDELINKIVDELFDLAIDPHELRNRLVLIMRDYTITEAETSLVVREKNENEYLIDRFIIAKKVKGCTNRTLQFYRNELRKILLFKIQKDASAITADDITLYLAEREYRDGVSSVTCDNELRALRTFFAWLRIEEIITKNPCEKIERIRHKGKKKKAFTEMEIEDLRVACGNNKERAVIEVLLSTGCRVTELVNIKIKDIVHDELIVHGKGQKDRKVYLSAKAQKSIELYINERTDENPYLFPKMLSAPEQVKQKSNIRNAWKEKKNVMEKGHMSASSIESMIRRIKKRAGVEEAYPHKFRRTCATMALRRGMPIEYVAQMLGHEQLSTTQIYLDLTDDDLKSAHKRYVT